MRSGALVAGALAAAGMLAGCAPVAPRPDAGGELQRSPQHHGPHNAIVRVVTDRPEVALSFDDGPDPRWTPAILRVLARAGVHATFFAVGARAARHPRLVHAELAAGHELANHTRDHVRLTGLGAAALHGQVVGGAHAIAAAGAPPTRLFRPPYGDFDSAVATAVSAAGERMIGWDVPLDRRLARLAPGAAGRNAADRALPGSIILAHDGSLDRRATLAALHALLRRLRQRGLRVVSVGELLAHTRAERRPARSPAG